MKKIRVRFQTAIRLFKNCLFRPLKSARFIKQWHRFNKTAGNQWPVLARDVYPILNEACCSAGLARGHYFLQDVWAAQEVFGARPGRHVDVGSRVDGFVAHVASFLKLEYVDLRPLDTALPNLQAVEGSILNLPYPDRSLNSVSSLHVLEHIGLGRYGDELDADGWQKGLKELARVLKPGGMLLLSVPVGKQRVCFNAHRIFHPKTIIEYCTDLKLIKYWLIPSDSSRGWEEDPGFEKSQQADYGCGLFKFEKTGG